MGRMHLPPSQHEQSREDKRLLSALSRALSTGRREDIDHAFEAIWYRHAHTVALICARYLRDDEAIACATDDVFIGFFRAVQREDFHLTVSLHAYLAASARNAALDHLRQTSRRNAHYADPILPANSKIADTKETDRLSLIPDPDADVGASLRYRELVQDLAEVLNTDAVEIILAHAVWGMSFREIAERLGRRENTVKTVYHRACAAFRRRKGEHWL